MGDLKEHTISLAFACVIDTLNILDNHNVGYIFFLIGDNDIWEYN